MNNTKPAVQKRLNEDMVDSRLADMSLITACFADTRTAVNCFVMSKEKGTVDRLR